MKRLVLLVFLLLFSVSVVIGDDVMPPPWRGGYGTTLSAWDAWNVEQTAPEISLSDIFEQNPQPPTLYRPYVFQSSALVVLDEYAPDQQLRNDVLVVEESIEIYLDNFDLENPFKDIWMQLTVPVTTNFELIYMSTIGTNADESESLLSGAMSEFLVGTINSGEWMTGIFSFELSPNPSHEVITLSTLPPEPALFIDQMVIDTWCHDVPEPSVWLLSGCGLLLLALRRKA